MKIKNSHFFLSWATFLLFVCDACAPIQSPTPSIQFEDASSNLLKAVNCETLFEPTAKWPWIITKIQQGYEDSSIGTIEYSQCYAYTHYKFMGSTKLALVYVILDKYSQEISIEAFGYGIKDFSGAKTQISLQPINSNEMASECLEDENYMDCLVEVRFAETIVHLRINTDKRIPKNEIESLINSLLVSLNSGIEKYILNKVE